MPVELDAGDLAKLDEEMATQWQTPIHRHRENSFVSAHPSVAVVIGQDRMAERETFASSSRSDDGSESQSEADHVPVVFATPRPPRYGFRGDHSHADIIIETPRHDHDNLDDDPLGLYADETPVLRRSFDSPPAGSSAAGAVNRSLDSSLSMHSRRSISGRDHQLELEQMAAIADLSVNDHDDHDFSFAQSPRQTPIQTAFDTFPAVDPPAPLSSPPSFPRDTSNTRSSNDDSRVKASLLQEIDRLKSENQRLLSSFDMERERLKEHYARSEQALASIRNSVTHENQVNLLQVKKELFAEKERQLESIRGEMRREREIIEMQMQDQLMVKERQWMAEKGTLQNQLAELAEKSARRPLTSSLSAQTDVPVTDENTGYQVQRLREMNADLNARNSDLQIQVAKQENELMEKSSEIVALADELEVLKAKYDSFSKTKKALIPDPKFVSVDVQTDHAAADINKDSIKDIEARYASAYEVAAHNLKESYNTLSNKLKAKSETVQNETVARVRAELEGIIHDKQSQLLKESSQSNALKKQVEWLESLLEDQKDQHQRALSQIKNQYLETLRQMRSDVTASKARSIERVKLAWIKKKEELDASWQQRLDEMRASYESERKENVQAAGNKESFGKALAKRTASRR